MGRPGPDRSRPRDRGLPTGRVDPGADRGRELVPRGVRDRVGWSSRPTATATTSAWWRPDPARRRRRACVTGSHLDSVPDGGAFDGPLGVVSALAAVDVLRARGFEPARPIGVAMFVEEEGARFGVACLGSRLATGVLDPARALALRDRDGVTLAGGVRASRVRHRAGLRRGPTCPTMAQVFVELHVEQGRWLAEAADPRTARSAWPRRSGRTAAGGWSSAAAPTTRARRGWRTARPDADRRLRRCSPPTSRRRLAGARRHDRPARDRPQRDQRHPVAGPRLARRPRRRPGRRSTPSWRPSRSRQPTGPARDGTTYTATASRCRRSSSSTRRCATGWLAWSASLGDGTPAPLLPTGAGHDAGILAAPGSRPRCSSSATPPASRTPRRSTPSPTTASPVSRRWRPYWRTWLGGGDRMTSYWCEHAWLGAGGVAKDVLVEVGDGRSRRRR